MTYYTYILGSINLTLYIGVTNDLIRRVYEHKQGIVEGFTKEYRINRLLYFEEFGDVELAILREKRLKNWRRQWKLELIRENNSYFEDLYENIVL